MNRLFKLALLTSLLTATQFVAGSTEIDLQNGSVIEAGVQLLLGKDQTVTVGNGKSVDNYGTIAAPTTEGESALFKCDEGRAYLYNCTCELVPKPEEIQLEYTPENATEFYIIQACNPQPKIIGNITYDKVVRIDGGNILGNLQQNEKKRRNYGRNFR